MSETANAQSRTIVGTVVDSAGRPLPYVNVFPLNQGVRVLADNQGVFQLRLPNKDAVKLELRRIGYLPSQVDIPSGADTNVTMSMIPLAEPMSPVLVSALRGMSKLETRGFFERLRERKIGANTGHFITQEEIERRHYPPLTSLLRGLPSVQIKHGAGGIAVPMSTINGGCVMETYLDGVRFEAYSAQALGQSRSRLQPAGAGASTMHPDPPPGSGGQRVDLGLDNVIQATTVAGIEVYPRPGQVPAQYQLLNGTCGVILIWTK